MYRPGIRSYNFSYNDRSRPVSEYTPPRRLVSIPNDAKPTDELMIRTAQLECERKLRKESDERYKQLLLKLEHTQAILNLRNQELARERAERKEAEHMCQSLKTTIDRLEQYLKRKNTTEDLHFVSNSNVNSITLSEITRLQGELNLQEEKDKVFQSEAQWKGTRTSRASPFTSSDFTKGRKMTCKSPKFRNFQNEDEFQT